MESFTAVQWTPGVVDESTCMLVEWPTTAFTRAGLSKPAFACIAIDRRATSSLVAGKEKLGQEGTSGQGSKRVAKEAEVAVSASVAARADGPPLGESLAL